MSRPIRRYFLESFIYLDGAQHILGTLTVRRFHSQSSNEWLLSNLAVLQTLSADERLSIIRHLVRHAIAHCSSLSASAISAALPQARERLHRLMFQEGFTPVEDWRFFELTSPPTAHFTRPTRLRCLPLPLTARVLFRCLAITSGIDITACSLTLDGHHIAGVEIVRHPWPSKLRLRIEPSVGVDAEQAESIMHCAQSLLPPTGIVPFIVEAPASSPELIGCITRLRGHLVSRRTQVRFAPGWEASSSLHRPN